MPKTLRADTPATMPSRPAPDGRDQPPTPPSFAEGESDTERVARRAYERFLMRGGEHGHDQEDWYEAERELHARTSE